MGPIMGYPPPIGQGSQLAQGVQRQGGGRIADGPRNPPVPHHNHYGTSGEREKGYADNYAMYSSNKDYPTLVNGERDRGRWGVRHDAPHAPHQAVHDAWNEPSDPYYDEPEKYEYECQDRSGEPTSPPEQRGHHNPVVYRPDGPTREPAVEYPNHPSHSISRLGRERGEAR